MIVGLLIKVLTTAAALWVAVTVLEGLRFEGSLPALLIVALLLGVVNAIVRPILTVLSLPLVVLSLGLFLLVINAAALSLVMALSGTLGIDFQSDGFGWTILGALLISLVTWLLDLVLPSKG
jgi:putative membrane protein